jgi:hypothetical protein
VRSTRAGGTSAPVRREAVEATLVDAAVACVDSGSIVSRLREVARDRSVRIMIQRPAMTDLRFEGPSSEERARWAALAPYSIIVERSWDGSAIRDDGPKLELSFTESELVVDIDAPYHGDPKPAAPRGYCPKLWEHEVVELFLLGSRERYLELEFGPHNHYVALRLAGVRQVQAEGMTLAYVAEIEGQRWSGRAHVPLEWLPPELCRFNAYAIDGEAARRRYWARFGVPGARPDFHRLECFGVFDAG